MRAAVSPGRTVVLLAAVTVGAAVAVAPTAAAPAPTPRPSSLVAPFDRLPVGPAPTTVPYAIGDRVVFAARSVTVPIPPMRYAYEHQLVKVAAVRGTVVTQWSYGSADEVNIVGRFSPTRPFAVLGSGIGGFSTFDVTVGGLVAMPETGHLRSLATGRVVARWTPLPACDYTTVHPFAVGYRVLQVEPQACTPIPGHPGERPPLGAASLWYPRGRPMRLPVATEAVGRLGVGWLGIRVRSRSDNLPRADCWDIVPASAPRSRGARLCSMTRPVVNADGSWRVVVQAGRVRAYRGASRSSVPMSLPAFDTWRVGARDAVPAAWETSDSFLITARYDGLLALVRCSASTGRCQRVVRTSVRPGVSWIATERGYVVDGADDYWS